MADYRGYQHRGNGQFIGDGVGTSANAGFDFIESPTNSGYEVLLDLNRVGASGTFSKAFGTQDITAMFATAPVMYTFHGNINFTSPGVNFSTELFQIGQSTPLLSEQYDMSNLSGGLGGSLDFGPLSGELLPGEAIEWDWSAEISPDAVADGGASLRANLDMTFNSLPEPTIACGLLFGLLLIPRRHWLTRP